MRIIGDIHGKYEQYKKLLINVDNSIQIGDFGIGFIDPPHNITNNHLFIRGNHDNPEKCQAHNNYLGDFGMYQDIFFISGAASRDKTNRIEGVSWWREEELNIKQMEDCFTLYKFNLPEIVISHDCPQTVFKKMFNREDSSNTRNFLQVLLDYHKPKQWLFGHHHFRSSVTIDVTRFQCLEELGTIDI